MPAEKGDVVSVFRLMVLGALVSSCAKPHLYVVEPLPAKAENCQFDRYTTADEVKRPYTEVCVIEGRRKRIDLMDDFTQKFVCKCGGDGVITGVTADTYKNGGSLSRIVYSIIKYKNQENEDGASPKADGKTEGKAKDATSESPAAAKEPNLPHQDPKVPRRKN